MTFSDRRRRSVGFPTCPVTTREAKRSFVIREHLSATGPTARSAKRTPFDQLTRHGAASCPGAPGPARCSARGRATRPFFPPRHRGGPEAARERRRSTAFLRLVRADQVFLPAPLFVN